MTHPHPIDKDAVGRAAAALVEPGMQLGLGTGSTVAAFLDALAARDLPEIAGVPTSEATATRCRELGIALLDPADTERLDLVVDGADELDGHLALTKGGGGALLREKVVAALGERFVVIAGRDKLVERLGATFALPVEVIPFAAGPVERTLRRHFGADDVVLRQRAGSPVLTDNGNVLLDATWHRGIADPASLAAALSPVPGIAEHGLFIDLATDALLADAAGNVQHLTAG